MCSVMAPPQKKLNGSTLTLLFGPYGVVGGGSGAWVWVKPTIAIIATGGHQGLALSSSEVGNGVVRNWGLPPSV